MISSNLKHSLFVVRLFHHPDLLLSPSRRPRDECSVRNGAAQTSGTSSDQIARGYETIINITRSFPFNIICCMSILSLCLQTSVSSREWAGSSCRAEEERHSSDAHDESSHSDGGHQNHGGSSSFQDQLLVFQYVQGRFCFWTDLLLCVVILSFVLLASGSARRRPTVAFVEAAQDRTGGMLRAQRSLSPEGHRSSSLPPRAQRGVPLSTPSEWPLTDPGSLHLSALEVKLDLIFVLLC